MSRRGLIIVGTILVLVAGYITIDQLVIQRKTETIISGGNEPTLTPGTWESETQAPEETTPPENLLASYQVAADQPRALYIDKLGIGARIMPMGIAADGSIQSPKNIFDAGWYTASSAPGQPGAAFLDGHASGATRQGLLAYLDTLRVGDTLQIEKGNGETLSYKVVNVETVPLDTMDMNKALSTYDGAEKGLNIMTCTGTWLPERLTYDHRVVVYTQQIEA
jgi:hypothetical protein